MDLNEYTLETLVRSRVAEMRQEAEKWQRVAPCHPASGRWRLALGGALRGAADFLASVRSLLW
jgi:hypothetical protein